MPFRKFRRFRWFRSTRRHTLLSAGENHADFCERESPKLPGNDDDAATIPPDRLRLQTYILGIKLKFHNIMTDGVIHIRHFGAQLRVRDGMFSLFLPDLSGNNDHKTHAFAAAHIQTVLLHPQTSFSTDAALLAEKEGVTCIIINEQGEPKIFLAGMHAPGALEVWKRQLELHGTPRGLAYARDWLLLKLQHKLEWLPKLRSYRRDQPDALRAIGACSDILLRTRNMIKQQPLTDVEEAAKVIRGHEGFGQKAWFTMLNYLLPPRYKFDGRSRQPSQDLFNAMLNYSYGILYNWVETALWEANVNPYFGFMHQGERGNKALLYDFIEPYRPWMDRAVFKLCTAKEVMPYHSEPLAEGGVWLTKEGKKLVADNVYDEFKKQQIEIGGKQWSLKSSIHHYARHLSADLKNALRMR